MHALPRRRGADGLRGEAKGHPKTRGPRPVMEPAGDLAVSLQAVCGGARRISPSCGQARSCWVFSCRNGGTRTRGLAAPSRARCQLRHIPEPSPSSPGAEAPMGQKEDGGVARRPGLEPGSTVLETAVLAIAPPTQREASMTPRAWPPGPPDGRRRGRLPRAPSRIRTGDLPLTRRLRYHWAIGALTVPPIAFSNA